MFVIGRFIATYRGKPDRFTIGPDYDPGQEYTMLLAHGDGMIAEFVVQSADRTRPTIIYTDREQLFRDWDSEQLQRVRARLQEAAQPKKFHDELPGPYFYIEYWTPFPAKWEPFCHSPWLHECACALAREGLSIYQRKQLVPTTYEPNHRHYWVREDAERIVAYAQQRWAYAQYRILPHQP